jgi:hypothetical protein
MFDISSTRTLNAQIHPPMAIFAMLGMLLLIGASFAGHGMSASKSRSWLHVLGLVVTLAVAVYVILDLEYPRLGVIRIAPFDRALVELRQAMR